MPSRNRVYLFRTPSLPDPYQAVLETRGWEAECVPVLAWDAVQAELLRRCVSTPDAYGGLIFTSPRAALFFGSELSNHPEVERSWKEKGCYCVGPATASELERVGFAPVGSTSGSASRLADMIEPDPHQRPLLFVCGTSRRDELPEALRARGVAFSELAIYTTRQRTDLNLVQLERPEWMVFFSPSGAEAVHSVLPESWSDVSCAAIGATTSAALVELGFEVRATATHPTPDSLARAIGDVRY